MSSSLSNTAAKSSHIGGGDQNLNLETDANAISKWQDAKIGLSVHWGPVALRGTEIGWSRGDQVPVQEYDALYKDFKPALFNAQEWVQLLKDSGIRYFTPVSKHHDGFVMFGTKQTDYNIMKSAWGRDWLKALSEECHKQGIMFGVYYSIMDWYQYDYSDTSGTTEPVPYRNKGGPGFKLDRKPDFERYINYMKAELKELIQDYGIEILIFDGNWDPMWTHDRGSDLYRYVHGLKPTLLVSNRVDTKGGEEDARMLAYDSALWCFHPRKFWRSEKYAGDYLEREEYIGGPAPYPWQSWITLGDQWAWKANDKNKSPEDCIRYLVEAAGGGGNFNLNVTPMPDGRFEQRQKDTLLKIGAWLKTNGESIYGTRGGPFEPGLWGASTQRGNKVYVHVLAWPAGTLRLPPLSQTVKSARLLKGGDVQWKQGAVGIEISVPDAERDPLDTIVELTVAG
jgi:alpha-L-fucosidase